MYRPENWAQWAGLETTQFQNCVMKDRYREKINNCFPLDPAEAQ